jgi:16S rRNA processing protein RimM
VDASPYIAVGHIVTTHGVGGELSVAPSTGLPVEDLLGCDVWIVPPVRLARPHTVASVRSGPKGPLVTLDGVTDVDHASQLVGHLISLPRADVPDEYLETATSHVGFAVRDETRGNLGNVEELIVTGANDVWVVRGDYGEVLIPVIDDVVLSVDGETRSIEVRLLPGLLEES